MSVSFYCPECASEQDISLAFSGDTACTECGEKFVVSTSREGVKVRKQNPYSPSNDISVDALDELNTLETRSLHESSLAAGAGAYVAAEFMSTRALESISRRLTGEGNWSDAIESLEEDYPELSSTIAYLKEERNKVAHPDKVRSTSSEAEQVYHMTVRMIEEIFGRDDTGSP